MEKNTPRPEHDPAADESDLLTVKEAAARLFDELEEAQQQRQRLSDDTSEAASLDRRIAQLREGMARYDQLAQQ